MQSLWRGTINTTTTQYKEVIKTFSNFVFDNYSSDEYGIMCVSFESTGLQTIVSQETDLQTERSGGNSTYHIITQQYKSPLTFTIQVVNRDCSPISSESERAIKKWLCHRGKYKLFTILDQRFSDIYFYANFSNPKLKVVSDVIGLEFTVTTNAPYGFSELSEYTYNLASGVPVNLYPVDNDEDLLIYPDMTIIMKESGNLSLQNTILPESGHKGLTINNLAKNEVITIKGNYPDAYSSVTSHNIFKDSNRRWLYLINENNVLKANKACQITLSYREYRKVGIV